MEDGSGGGKGRGQREAEGEGRRNGGAGLKQLRGLGKGFANLLFLQNIRVFVRGVQVLGGHVGILGVLEV